MPARTSSSPPRTAAQRTARRNRDAAAAATRIAPASPPEQSDDKGDDKPGSGLNAIDPRFLIRHTLTGSHDAMATLLDMPALRLTKMEADVSTEAVSLPLEMSGLTIWARYLAPFCAVIVLLALELKRARLMREEFALRRAERQAAEEAGLPGGYVSRAARAENIHDNPVVAQQAGDEDTPKGNGRAAKVPQFGGQAANPDPISIDI